MLESTDTDKVRTWLAQALIEADKRGLSKAGLARHCDVTPQAVNGWAKTGRIKKSHLEKAAEYFGHGPSFEGARLVARESFTNWPFPKVERARFEALPPSERDKIESHALFVISEWERARLQAAPGAAAAGRSTARIYIFKRRNHEGDNHG
jgi:hypothetical protein